MPRTNEYAIGSNRVAGATCSFEDPTFVLSSDAATSSHELQVEGMPRVGCHLLVAAGAGMTVHLQGAVRFDETLLWHWKTLQTIVPAVGVPLRVDVAYPAVRIRLLFTRATDVETTVAYVLFGIAAS
jgi:hypothetical protein